MFFFPSFPPTTSWYYFSLSPSLPPYLSHSPPHLFLYLLSSFSTSFFIIFLYRYWIPFVSFNWQFSFWFPSRMVSILFLPRLSLSLFLPHLFFFLSFFTYFRMSKVPCIILFPFSSHSLCLHFCLMLWESCLNGRLVSHFVYNYVDTLQQFYKN